MSSEHEQLTNRDVTIVVVLGTYLSVRLSIWRFGLRLRACQDTEEEELLPGPPGFACTCVVSPSHSRRTSLATVECGRFHALFLLLFLFFLHLLAISESRLLMSVPLYGQSIISLRYLAFSSFCRCDANSTRGLLAGRIGLGY